MPQMNVGKPIRRLEGREKVTGNAKYTADHPAENLLYGYVVNSAVTKGKITKVDTAEAEQSPGVVKIYTYKNRPKIASLDLKHADMDAPPGTVFKHLDSDKIQYNGQPIALVVAKDFETARYAATLVKFEIKSETHAADLKFHLDKARKPKSGLATVVKPPPPKPTGDFEKAFQNSEYKMTARFTHSAEYHNPMELFATTAIYEGKKKLKIYEKTQGTINSQLYVANVFGLKYKNVQVLAPYVGGAFGSGLRPQYQLFFAAMAALDLEANVRVVMDRKQMFTFGHRPQSVQDLSFSADRDGKLTGLKHHVIAETSEFEDYAETTSEWSHKLYPSPSTDFKYEVVSLNHYTPTDMRAPGGATGIPAVECAMDDLACQMNMDPLEFRLKNYAEVDPITEKPFTSKELRECYLQAAEKFGWKNRSPKPGGMKRRNKMIGYGMATGMWDAFQFPAKIEAAITTDGKLQIKNAATDIGTGTFTVITQIAADELGLTLEDVSFEYGDSKLPFSMFQGGSALISSNGSAVKIAAKELRKKLFKIAKSISDSPLKNLKEEEVIFQNGFVVPKEDSAKKVSFLEIIKENKGKTVEVSNLTGPHILKLKKYAKAAHSACFAEVEIDAELKTINVSRVVCAVAAGKIINPKTAESQIRGSIVWGISKTLQEGSLIDEKLGKIMNQNLAEYHIPVHADIGELEVIFVDEKDEIINELGSKGVGEIGLVAVPAAICNAIYNATGKRVYDLPFHFDKLLD